MNVRFELGGQIGIDRLATPWAAKSSSQRVPMMEMSGRCLRQCRSSALQTQGVPWNNLDIVVDAGVLLFKCGCHLLEIGTGI